MTHDPSVDSAWERKRSTHGSFCSLTEKPRLPSWSCESTDVGFAHRQAESHVDRNLGQALIHREKGKPETRTRGPVVVENLKRQPALAAAPSTVRVQY